MLVLKYSCYRPVNLLKINFFTGYSLNSTKSLYLISRNSSLFLEATCVGCSRIYLHKSNHHLMIWIHGFEEVKYMEIYEKMYRYHQTTNPAPPSSTLLHPALSTSDHFISTFTQLHPAPPSSFLPPPSSLQHPQRY